LGQRLERWILDECFGIAGQWHMRWGNDAPPLHVNISTGLLHRGDLNQQVSSALHVASIPARSIILELTEHDLEAVRPSLSAELASLKQMGIRLAVDDFGTGYSAFSRLSELPLDELKIDYSFTSRMLHDERSRAVVTAVLRLAQSLGLATVAEGVESLDQVEFLLDNGCDYGQGFLWGRGVPVEEFADNYAQQHESASGTVGR
jgi:EAL domain-containing protein (putative c-di-GMP-specific phosphodiesterase class I)